MGATVGKDERYGEVESVKAVSDLIAPLSGEVLEVNQKVVDAPETVNEDPYGEGWLIRIRLTNPAERERRCSTRRAYREAARGRMSGYELPLPHRRRPRGDARGDRRRVHRGAVPRHPGRRAAAAARSTLAPALSEAELQRHLERARVARTSPTTVVASSAPGSTTTTCRRSSTRSSSAASSSPRTRRTSRR